jgi:hypothetical protein
MLGLLKSGNNPNHKSPYFYIKMGKNSLKSILSGPYVMINQLIKSIWKVAHLDNSLIYMLGGKKNQSNKNNQDKDLRK